MYCMIQALAFLDKLKVPQSSSVFDLYMVIAANITNNSVRWLLIWV